VFRTLFKRKEASDPTQPMVDRHIARVPPGVCVYAIGDIHGRADLLHALREQIVADSLQLTPGTEKIVVYMGDYVDRGLESRQVVDTLI
jgi:serine/threonine protein phosphatase 1